MGGDELPPLHRSSCCMLGRPCRFGSTGAAQRHRWVGTCCRAVLSSHVSSKRRRRRVVSYDSGAGEGLAGGAAFDDARAAAAAVAAAFAAFLTAAALAAASRALKHRMRPCSSGRCGSTTASIWPAIVQCVMPHRSHSQISVCRTRSQCVVSEPQNCLVRRRATRKESTPVA